MVTKPATLLDRGLVAARQSIMEAVRTRYFPEIWYILENWFMPLKRKRVLVVGQGFGMVAEALAKSGFDVTVVDPSLSALTELRESFSRDRLQGDFEQAEPDALPFANGAFTAVASINTVELAQSSYQAVHEIARVLAPGGRAVITTFNKLGPWGLPAIMRTVRPEDDRRKSRCVTKAGLQKMLKAADLDVEDIKDRAQYLPVGKKTPKLPIAGAFIALVGKSTVPKATKHLESSIRPRSRPSLSRQAPKKKSDS